MVVLITAGMNAGDFRLGLVDADRQSPQFGLQMGDIFLVGDKIRVFFFGNGGGHIGHHGDFARNHVGHVLAQPQNLGLHGGQGSHDFTITRNGGGFIRLFGRQHRPFGREQGAVGLFGLSTGKGEGLVHNQDTP